MYMILHCATGVRVVAVLLKATDARMRAILINDEDAVEFRLADDRWISEDGFAVEIESLITTDPGAVQRVLGGMRLRTCSAVS